MKSPAAIFRLMLVPGLCLAEAIHGQSAPAITADSPAAPAAGTSASADGTIPELHIGKEVYYKARVLNATPTTVMLGHRDGIVSVPMADLPVDLQKRLGYDPTKAAAETARLKAAEDARKIAANAAAGDKAAPVLGAQEILQRFGQPPKIFAEVNMQPRFDELGVGVKNQGARASCAVFALVSALEYESSPAKGPAPEFSEEYLIWATLKSLGKVGLAVPKGGAETLDIGFYQKEVGEALKAYGVATEDELPYHFVLADPHIIEPAPEVIAAAKKRTPAAAYGILGREPKMQLANIVQVLNAGVPVVTNVKWPDQKKFGDNARLDDQTGIDNNGHAILLVGYHTKTGKIEDAEFLFKNSYGEKWGDRGYGVATYTYLSKYLQSALFLDAR